MTIVANTFLTYSTIGINEDLTNNIYNISPEETPFMTGIGRGSMTQTLQEWQTDSLVTPVTTNAQIEGDDVTTYDAVVPTVRVGNYAQISRKTLILSDTDEVVDKAGRKSELAYQLAKKSAELKRDLESTLLDNIAATTGNSTTARKTGTMGAWIKTNTSIGAGGANPVYTTLPNNARTDGTQRTFTEALLKTVIQACWTSGATPKVVLVGATNKALASAFAGVATKTYYQSAARPAVTVAAADVYVSDFGRLDIVPDRFQRTRDAWVLDYEWISMMFLRKFKTVDLAKTGDAEKRMLIVEWGLRVNNEAAEGIVADLS